MKYFIDTEFAENGAHQPIDLISIGIVAEDGREYYATSAEFRPANVNDWVRENVLPALGNWPETAQPLFLIQQGILKFIGDDRPEFWGYYSDYDWVVFCQIFGAMIHLPKGWPMYCRDIKQWCDQLGNPRLPAQIDSEHHALYDARWNKRAWEFLATK
jgi:3'-5' exoribonuclease Rv2179c-like domain